jgi:hypothetical protein
MIITLVFEKKTNFFRRKMTKIAENCDHNIDPRANFSHNFFREKSIPAEFSRNLPWKTCNYTVKALRLVRFLHYLGSKVFIFNSLSFTTQCTVSYIHAMHNSRFYYFLMPWWDSNPDILFPR